MVACSELEEQRAELAARRKLISEKVAAAREKQVRHPHLSLVILTSPHNFDLILTSSCQASAIVEQPPSPKQEVAPAMPPRVGPGRGARGWSPLHAACANGNHEVVALLLAAGADYLQPDAMGRLASDLAMEYGHTHCVELVQQRQAMQLDKACPGVSKNLLQN